MTAFAHDIYLKHVVVVDGDVDIDSSADILRAVTIFSQADTDWLIMPNCRGPRTDPSGYTLDARGGGGSMTTKVGIDATPRLGAKKIVRADQIHPEYRDLDLTKYLP
jgi:UbiD family decarboxylase